MIKFLIYKYRSPRENENSYQSIIISEEEKNNQTTSTHNSNLQELSFDESMIFSNYVSDIYYKDSCIRSTNYMLKTIFVSEFNT